MKGFGGEHERPDRVGVILDFVKLSNGLPGGVFQMWETSEDSLASDYVRRTTLLVLGEEVWVVHIPLRDSKRIFVPKSRTVTDEIAASLAEEDVAVAAWP